MEIITVSTPFNIDLEFAIAPIYKRLLAWLVDIVIVYSYVYLMMRFAIPSISMSSAESTVFVELFIMLPALFYHLLSEFFGNGQSAGKKLLGIKVVDVDGKEPSLSQYLLRWVLRLIDMGVTMGMGALLSSIFTVKHQRLGDLAAGTVVIDQTGKTTLHETIYVDIGNIQGYKPSFPEVMRLTDRDINGIRKLLQTPASRESETYAWQVTYKIKEVLGIETGMQPREFLEQLLKDYNFLTRK